jgi:hypothetical protein
MKAKASSHLTPCLCSSPAHSAHDTRFRHLPIKDKNENRQSNEGSIEVSPCCCSSLWSPCRANHPIPQGDFLCNTKGRRRSWVNTQKSYKTANNSSTVGFVASVYVSNISHQKEPHKSRSCSLSCKKSKEVRHSSICICSIPSVKGTFRRRLVQPLYKRMRTVIV